MLDAPAPEERAWARVALRAAAQEIDSDEEQVPAPTSTPPTDGGP